MSLSTLRPVFRSSIVSLSNDSLLYIFELLSLPQLLELISISRRMHQLIVQHIFPQYRTLLYGYSYMEKGPLGEFTPGPGIVQLYFSKHLHPFTDFCQRLGIDLETSYLHHIAFNRRPRQFHQSLLTSLPNSLPNILPRICSLTFSLFLSIPFLLSNEHIAVNRLYTSYLTSPWATNLVSLHLFIEVIIIPVGNTSSFLLLNDLPALRHLFLEFTKSANIPLPDTMPILGQFTSFSLLRYLGPNTVTLLQQLGPNLTFLSLFELFCSADDFDFFLQNNPSFSDTLETLEIDLPYLNNRQLFTVVSQYLPSLNRFLCGSHILDNFFPILEDINRLVHLQEVNLIFLATRQLRLLRDSFAQDALPRLLSIRTATMNLMDDDRDNFKASEVFDDFIPLLASIFCALERVNIFFLENPYSQTQNCSPALSDALTTQIKIHFKTATMCIGGYFS